MAWATPGMGDTNSQIVGYALTGETLGISVALLDQGGSTHRQRMDLWNANVVGSEQIYPRVQQAVQQAQNALANYATVSQEAQRLNAPSLASASTAAQQAASALTQALAQATSDVQALQGKTQGSYAAVVPGSQLIAVLQDLPSDLQALNQGVQSLWQATNALQGMFVPLMIRSPVRAYGASSASGMGDVKKASNSAAVSSAGAQMAAGVAAGAAAGAAIGAPFLGVGALVGGAIGAIVGAIPGTIAMVNALQGGTSHADRMASWNGALATDVSDANLSAVPSTMQAAMTALQQFQALLASAQASASSAVAQILAQAQQSNGALAQAGDALVADATTYQNGRAQITPWTPNSPAQQALQRLPVDVAATNQALAGAQASNAALASVLGGGP